VEGSEGKLSTGAIIAIAVCCGAFGAFVIVLTIVLAAKSCQSTKSKNELFDPDDIHALGAGPGNNDL
jgi:hypothetical protein